MVVEKMYGIVMPWTITAKATMQNVMLRIVLRKGLLGKARASATARPPRSPPQVSVALSFLGRVFLVKRK